MKTMKNQKRQVKLPRVMFIRLRGFIDHLFIRNWSIDKTTGKFSSPYITALVSVISIALPDKREVYAGRLYRLSDEVTQTCIDLEHLPPKDAAINGSTRQKRMDEQRKRIMTVLYKKYSELHRELSNTTIPEEEEIHEFIAHVNYMIAQYMRGFNFLRRHTVSDDSIPFLDESDREKIHAEFMNIRSGAYIQKALDHVSHELAVYEG